MSGLDKRWTHRPGTHDMDITCAYRGMSKNPKALEIIRANLPSTRERTRLREESSLPYGRANILQTVQSFEEHRADFVDQAYQG